MPGHLGVLPISDQKALILTAFACTPSPRISGACSSGGGAGGGTVGISTCVVAVDIPSSGRDATGGPDTPESMSTSKFHFVPTSRHEDMEIPLTSVAEDLFHVNSVKHQASTDDSRLPLNTESGTHE